MAPATYELTVNGQKRSVTADPGTPLLWILRDELKLTGTKYGCGIAACGACTVHVGGVATRSCVVPVSLIGDRPIVTIEAISQDPVGRAVQDAWVSHDVVRHPGILNSAAHRVLTDRLDGDDWAVADQRHGNNARAGRDAADVYRARAAGGDAAAVLGSGQLQLVPQDPEQRRSRISGHRPFLTIDGELIRGGVHG